MNENQIAGARIARAAIKVAQEGHLELAQNMVKTADAVYQGYAPDEALHTFWNKETHEKIASFLNEVINRPSAEAVQRHELLKEARVLLIKEIQQYKEAQQKEAATQQTQPLQLLFGKQASGKKKV